VFAVLAVEVLPTVVVGLLLGPLLDRLERRSLMMAADVLRVGVFVALPFAPNAAVVVVLALVAGLATGFFRPAVYAGVPNLVPEEELPRANALLQTVENLSWMLGPIVGGLLQSGRALSRGHWRDLADGFSAALHSRSMLAVLVGWGIASFGIGGGQVSTIFLAKDTFAAGDFGYGLLYGATGAGLVLGSFASAAVLDRYGVARVYGGSLLVMALAYVAAAVSPDVWVAAGCCVVLGVGNGAAVACNALLVQRGTFDILRGRALTFVMSATYLLVGAGEGLGGLFLHQAGARWLWGGAGATVLVAAFAGWLFARRVGSEPAAEAEEPARETLSLASS
jgi:MFS family permease